MKTIVKIKFGVGCYIRVTRNGYTVSNDYFKTEAEADAHVAKLIAEGWVLA